LMLILSVLYNRKTPCLLGRIFHKQRAKASATDYTNFTEPM